MNLIRRLLARYLTREQLLVFGAWKRRLSWAAEFADSSYTIPESIFDRRPLARHESRHGSFFLPADSVLDPAATANRLARFATAGLAAYASRYVRGGSVVVNVGAGYGFQSLILSELVGPEGQVFAFEADEFTFDILQKNIETNCRENIRAFLGLMNKNVHRVVASSGIGIAGVPAYTRPVLAVESTESPAPDRTLDELEIHAPISALCIDTPGNELEILRGAEKTIQSYKMPILIDFEGVIDMEAGHIRKEDILAFANSIDYRLENSEEGAYVALIPNTMAPQQPEISGAVVQVLPKTEAARPIVVLEEAPFQKSLCKLLRRNVEVEECTRYLKRNGLVSHSLRCKDWDLAHIIPAIGDGNFLDMGSSDSYILKNLSIKGIRGEKFGIDLRQPDVPVNDVQYLLGDLTKTALPDGHFANITCLSVLEHQVDFGRFAAEAGRLLATGGCLFVTFDYWEPKVRPPARLYRLDWQPLDAALVNALIRACADAGLHLLQEFDWRTENAVIHWGYYSPHPDVAYTFGLAVFVKR